MSLLPNDLPPIDLRSDTVTQPDAAMRRAMAEAEVGDDVYGEDPTVEKLQEEAAETLGHEAALFVPSGTMGNQIALHLLGRPGHQVICDARAHVQLYELGGMAMLSGLQPRTLVTADGRLEAAAVEGAISPDDGHSAPTAVVALENTHNMAGGTVYPVEQTRAIQAVARRFGLGIHLDGARLFNAAVALDLPPARLAEGFDTVTFCLSKGLGAPVGSLLCGGAERIREARRVRKVLGGGMRQVGVLAAAGRLALAEGPGRLAEDHAKARRLAEGLAEMDRFSIDPARVETNIVLCSLAATEDPAAAEILCRRLQQVGVLCYPVAAATIRFVTHRDVSRSQIEEALQRIRDLD